MTLKNEKFGKLINEIFLTFSLWESYEVLGKVITSNKILIESIQSVRRQFVEVKLFT